MKDIKLEVALVNDLGDTETIVIKDIRDDITHEDAYALANVIINNNVMTPKKGEKYVEVNTVKVITITEEEI